MSVATQMLQTRPDERGVDHARLADVLDALSEVALVATNCADSCISVEADMSECAKVCADAADVAAVTARVLTRTGPTVEGSRTLLDATARMLAECSTQCREHGGSHKHCRFCAEVCQQAERAIAGLQADIADIEVGRDS